MTKHLHPNQQSSISVVLNSRAEHRPAWIDPTLFPFDSRFVHVDGHVLHYVDEGTGPTLLFLHPGPGWCFYFHEFICQLRDQFRCVAVDYPGFGLSVSRAGYRYSLREHSEAVERFIDALGLANITLVVHDAGGPIGLGVAVRRPERFRGFVLTSTFGWPLTDYPRVRFMLKFVSSPPFQLLNMLFNLLPHVVVNFAPRRRTLTRAEKHGIVGAFCTWGHRRRILTLFRDLATDVEYLRGVEEGLKARLSDRPTLIMYREVDPVRQFGFDTRFESIFPQHRSVVIAGEQHFAHLAAAPEMIAHIRDFWPLIEQHHPCFPLQTDRIKGATGSSLH